MAIFSGTPLSESAILQAITPYMATGVSMNEDAHILPGGFALTSDMLVEGTHFDLAYSSFEDIGWKAASINISDLNAMLAQPLWFTVNIGLPPSATLEQVQALYAGFQQAVDTSLAGWGIEPRPLIIGGDTVRAERWIISVTALGERADVPAQWGLRSVAKPGNRVLLAGEPGLSALGLKALQEGLTECDAAMSQHRRPEVRSHDAKTLRDIYLNKGPKALTLMDTSDGLADGVIKIAKASIVVITLEEAKLPWHPELVGRGDRLDMALYGGEDFGLLACLPEDCTIPEGFIEIGVVHSLPEHNEAGAMLQREDGSILPLNSASTFQHFEGPSV